jgi:hypothetical protein
MKVSDLQAFLKSLIPPLQATGARQAANDLERGRAGLEPFADLSVAEFADFLARAHKYSVDGVVPVKGKGTRGSATVDADKVKAASQSVQQLHEQALDPAFQETVLDAELKKLEKQLNKDEAIEVARQLNIVGTLKTKKDALSEIRRKIARRRDTLDRVEV